MDPLLQRQPRLHRHGTAKGMTDQTQAPVDRPGDGFDQVLR